VQTPITYCPFRGSPASSNAPAVPQTMKYVPAFLPWGWAHFRINLEIFACGNYVCTSSKHEHINPLSN